MKIDREMRQYLARGSIAFIAGSADAGGTPFAMRAWGASVVEPDGLRLFFPAALMPRVSPGSWLSVSVTDITNYQSYQFKGRVAAVEETTSEERAACTAYWQTFGAAAQMLGLPPLPIERVAEAAFAVFVRVERVYRQTPGPGAGEVLPS